MNNSGILGSSGDSGKVELNLTEQIYKKFNEEKINKNKLGTLSIDEIKSVLLELADEDPKLCATLISLSTPLITGYVRAGKDIVHCKWKSYINKNFSKLYPKLAFLDYETTNYYFLTLRPKWLLGGGELSKKTKDVKKMMKIFERYVDDICDGQHWDWGIGCFEITAGEGDRMKDSLHAHILLKTDSGCPKVKKMGYKYYLKDTIRKFKTQKFVDRYGEFMETPFQDAALDIELRKGYKGTLKYIRGLKKNENKADDVEITRKWRLLNEIPPLFYLGNSDNIPEEMLINEV